MACVCGLEGSYESCCAPFHRGERKPESAERLMRSRYAAFVRGEIDYLLGTHAPETRDRVDRQELEVWSRESEWQGLEVHRAEGGPADAEGTVEFTARYRLGGRDRAHRECSHFRRTDDGWIFVDGHVKGETIVAGPKVGRNDPCPCGSGRKFKRCCAAGL